jgi:hypothetical protein
VTRGKSKFIFPLKNSSGERAMVLRYGLINSSVSFVNAEFSQQNGIHRRDQGPQSPPTSTTLHLQGKGGWLQSWHGQLSL